MSSEPDCDVNLEEPIKAKQLLNQIDLVVNDVSNVKEKYMKSNEDYEKIKEMIEHLRNKTKELKCQIENSNESVDSVEWQKLILSIENVVKKLEQHKSEFEQLKKGRMKQEVSYLKLCLHIL